MASGEAIIEVKGLTTRFGDNVVHENLNLEVRRGEIIGIVGGSGTGKSVLLHTILGLKKPDAGNISVFGLDLTTMPDDERRLQERRWGVLFQDGALFSGLTVAQNIQVPFREHLNMNPVLMDELAAVKIEMVGLRGSAAVLYPSELSGGMTKRAGLARALALDPEILFLDEPTAGLDPIGATAFDELITDLKKTLGLTVFMVTHDLDTLRATCDRIAVLAERRVILVGTIDDMLRSSYPWIREYFHGPRARAAFAAR
ncbi:MAG: ABC transporter ATP-binding protein [Parvibaculum sp.]|jgi:phospholipid/cholesterol/gamma-HCH transport system ATP-binding protein|uniref:ABC transporter ATP-binding protein n=1 Tax=Parvibaculum sp. TaxID=2024848 RepID=UPI00284EE864|nr:ABC transporter ATP-binding protein [Parvibaculum sp.]MDR3500526.1 ABC transporter ATP-binding protein [Parvibaculum sp.]